MKAQREAQGALPRQPSSYSLVNAGEKQVTHMLTMGPRKGPREGRLLAEAKGQGVLYGAGRGTLRTATFVSNNQRGLSFSL